MAGLLTHVVASDGAPSEKSGSRGSAEIDVIETHGDLDPRGGRYQRDASVDAHIPSQFYNALRQVRDLRDNYRECSICFAAAFASWCPSGAAGKPPPKCRNPRKP